MAEKPEKKRAPHEEKHFQKEVRDKERRKLKAQGAKRQDIWFGLGFFGIVGWSVAIPTVLGIFLGVWIDSRSDSPRSWTLMLLIIGLIAGLLNAWFWVQRQRDAIEKERNR